MLLERRTAALDPIVSTRMVAKSLLANFANGNPLNADQMSLENMIRLLKRFESNTIRPYRPVGMVDRMRTRDLNQKLAPRLGDTLHATINSVCATIDTHCEPVTFARRILRSFESLRNGTATQGDISEAKRFLNTLAIALQNV